MEGEKGKYRRSKRECKEMVMGGMEERWWCEEERDASFKCKRLSYADVSE